MAEDNQCMDLAAYGTDITNTNTILRSRAYDEKLERHRQDVNYAGTSGWDAVDEFARGLLDRRGEGWQDRGDARAQYALASGGLQRPPADLRTISKVPVPNGSSTASSSAQKRSGPVPLPIAPSPKRVAADPHGGASSPHLHQRRRELAKKWTMAAHDAGAARIDIINDVDDDEIPPVEETFKYLEREYLW